uniref:Hexosyltransferase n=1 Tax=Panagrolaimus sp. JU765 TaxID=591449 RepID=A0AC34Q6S9_9BILA
MEVCTKESVIIAVLSGPDKFMRRKWVRKLWSNQKLDSQIILFFVGKSQDVEIQKKVEQESEKFNDLVVVDFFDSYKNLSIKMYTVLKWSQIYCPEAKYLLRTIDDCIVDLPNFDLFIKREIQKNDPQTKKIYGNIYEYPPVIRDPENKW